MPYLEAFAKVLSGKRAGNDRCVDHRAEPPRIIGHPSYLQHKKYRNEHAIDDQRSREDIA